MRSQPLPLSARAVLFRTWAVLLLSCLLLTALACAPEPGEPGDSAPEATALDLAGLWRGVLASPGGELPFTLRIEPSPTAGAGFRATILNGEEEVPVSAVRVEGRDVVLAFEGYDSWIDSELSPSGDHLEGVWEKTSPEGLSRLEFTATRGDDRRFLPRERVMANAEVEAPESITGVWAVEFRDQAAAADAPVEPARGELTQNGAQVRGTFLTPTGDYRYLVGRYDAGLLRLSTFDGAHAFLFKAQARLEEGEPSLEGDFWSRDSYHATWTARPAGEGEELLPDPWELVALRSADERFEFSFPDLDGAMVAHDDPRFAGKVVLVNLFGSWCPNCNDEAPQLAEWHRRYRDRGLEIVGLAYEHTGDAQRDRTFVRRYGERHGIGFPLLLAGVSDKAAAAGTLPGLSAVVAYPTNIFIGRDGRVHKIYSGYAGPGTGEHNRRLVAELEGVIEELLAEEG